MNTDIGTEKNVVKDNDTVSVSVKNPKLREYTKFDVYTKRIVTSINPICRIKKESRAIFDQIIDTISVSIIEIATENLIAADRTNMSFKDIMTGVLMIFPMPLATASIEYAKKSVDRYNKYVKTNNYPVSKQDKAGLRLPVSRIRTKIQQHIIKHKHIGDVAPVFLTGILEYIVIKILEPSCTETLNCNIITIGNEHIKLGISKNPDLEQLFVTTGLYFCNNQLTTPLDNEIHKK